MLPQHVSHGRYNVITSTMYLWGLKLISRAVDNSPGMWALKGQTKIQSIRTNNHAVELIIPSKAA